MLYYFAYGSNMSFDRLKQRGVQFKNAKKGSLKWCRLTFNKQSQNNHNIGFANIENNNSDHVEGIIYEIDELNLQKLDICEGFPEHYRKELMQISSDTGLVKCFVYMAQPKWINNSVKPEKEYVKYLLDGKDFLSPTYYKTLEDLYNVLS